MGTPTEADFIEMVKKGTLTNCPVTPVDIADACHVFGPDLPGIKSKTVRRKPARVEVEDDLVTRTISDNYHCFVSVTLTADVMSDNGLPFLVTMSCHIRLLTVEHTPSRMAKQLGSSITKSVILYARGIFVTNIVLMDKEFVKIVDEVPKLEINTTAVCEHVGENNFAIRNVKEQSRAVVSYQPNAVLSKPIVIHLVYFYVLWLNKKPNDK